MFSRVISGTVQGIDAVMIQVEADMSDGLPAFVMVGYLSSCVREAAERVRTALRNSGVSVPPRRITVNLSPADIRKDGTAFDLPIAVCILISMGIISEEAIKNTMIIGELGLNGDINGVPGVLSMVHYASEHGINRFIVPRANMEEAGLIKGIEVIAVSGLQELIDYECNGRKVIHDMNKSTGYYPDDCYDLGDFADIKGQVMLKRGVEIAVAGLHNIMMTGAAGSGKTMIARRIPTIMPKLTFDESIEVTKIYSVAGMLKNGRGLITKRPFRAPHHTISTTALVGGGVIPGPGEISLADHGVLFLDEFPEFGRNVLETLRQPLEDREVNISRLSGRYRFPADFMLVTARNNCPCGGWPNANKCTCTYKQIRNYNARENLIRGFAEELKRKEIAFTYPGHELYPERLLNIPDRPRLLFIMGQHTVLEELNAHPSLAVVGSRMATNYGISMCRRIVSHVAKEGVAIISGMAAGIDGVAHSTVLDHHDKVINALCNLTEYLTKRTF